MRFATGDKFGTIAFHKANGELVIGDLVVTGWLLNGEANTVDLTLAIKCTVPAEDQVSNA